jgi:DNA-binding SARP family transcriptional activator
MPRRGIELVAYLNLNGPVDGRQMQMAFWPDTAQASNNQRQLAKKVRVALGHTLDGMPLLPENTQRHGYQLDSAIRSDWDDFRALTGNDPATAATEALVEALRLVRGQPFANCNTRRWWHWIAVPEEEMIAAVLDTANELASRALTAHDLATARFAAHIAQTADPLNEAGWRIQLRIAARTGDRAEFDRILDDLYTRLGSDDPDYELDDITQQLVDQYRTEKATTV